MQVHVTCDQPGCPLSTAGGVGENYWDVVNRLNQRGWLTTNGHYCPAHKLAQLGKPGPEMGRRGLFSR